MDVRLREMGVNRGTTRRKYLALLVNRGLESGDLLLRCVLGGKAGGFALERPARHQHVGDVLNGVDAHGADQFALVIELGVSVTELLQTSMAGVRQSSSPVRYASC